MQSLAIKSTLGLIGVLLLTQGRAPVTPPSVTLPAAALPPVVLPADPNDLSMQVAALQAMYNFNLTPAQLDHLATVAGRQSTNRDSRLAGTISPKLLIALRAAHEAYLSGDEKVIGTALEKFDALYASEPSDLDDLVVITTEARRQTSDFVRQLSPGQVANYFAYFSTQWRGPSDRLMEALASGRSMSDDTWQASRDAIAGDVAWLMAGCDEEAFADAKSRVVQMLDRAHRLDEQELAKIRPDLEATVRRWTVKLGPVEVLKHAMERDVASLLSNPRLATAVAARKRAPGK